MVHGLKYLMHEARSRGIKPDFKLLWAMIYYIDAFPEKLHHPKENAYLFRRLRMRTREADAVLDELEKQHTDGARNVRGAGGNAGALRGGGSGWIRAVRRRRETSSATRSGST
ncbi:MAG: hypothetical protein MZW92_51590 [Comamonadaceae bacterium]|nr:hypothetical protein [Comamonadaceae bacterium]